MSPKPPSSLDYDVFLHELALRNWTRALLDADGSRAETNASRLASSHDKFWRFIGLVHLGRARLCRGLASPALDALADAVRAYPEAQELGTMARTLAAHVHLETHSPRRALDTLEHCVETTETRYWRALAYARLSRPREAEALLEGADSARFDHVMGELGTDRRIESLERASDQFSSDALGSPEPAAPIHFALAGALLDLEQIERAGEIFDDISASRETLLHWPIPYVRSLYWAGRLAVQAGRDERAMQAFSEFLLWWKDGELDRAEVEEAAQFVNA